MPERPRVVVVNTTPLISLAIIKRLDLLQRLYGEVLIPPAVEKEVMAGGQKSEGYVDLSECPFVRTVPLKDPSRADLLADLHGGEAEAIALAQELNADLVIIDERLGRAHAKRLGLQLTGVVGVLLRAKKSGLITAIGPLLRQLVEGGIWLSDDLVQEALRLADES